MKLTTLNLIQIGWNEMNGLTVSFLELEINCRYRSLLGINISRDFFYFDILFISIKVFNFETY